ncbi:hypothetical protein FD50_GL001655 [Liquorilactobacillus satsumensis DSM 16230 = JCM 12392]|uniref:DegV family protein n=2 Tax=Liquorilactobacillus satsumensis TaxID=259059 RepID=A0A0R1UV80_9LACO|nr:hypothetical protein FD50_GL001655 [Liquorilactobacillus satsumensis DSM 16230 = JCM 12392]
MEEIEMIHIITDSTAQLSEQEVEKYQITVIPLQVSLAGKSGLDGQDISRQSFSKALAVSDDVPQTSQPALGQFLQVYDSLGQQAAPLLSIHLTETLSGTVKTARIAAAQTKAAVTVLDSNFTDRALGLIVIKAAELGRKTTDVNLLVKEIHQYAKKIRLDCFINNLDYLVKNGRASRATGFIASAIKLKLLVTLEEGKFKVIGKSHGQKRFNLKINEIVKQIIADRSISQVGLSYVDEETTVLDIKRQLEQARPELKIFCALTSPVIMAHVGHAGFAIITV